MPAWPATLPAPLIEGFSTQPANNVQRTPMDVGPPKTRKITSANIRPMSFSLLLTSSQLATLRAFFEDDVAGGATAFTFEDPETGDTVNAKFAQPYSAAHSSGLWRVSVSLEIQP